MKPELIIVVETATFMLGNVAKMLARKYGE